MTSQGHNAVIMEAIQSLPEELRATAESDFRWLESHARGSELSAQGLARLVADPTEPSRARAVGAWIIGLIRESSLAPVLGQVLRSGAPAEVLWEGAKALCALGRGGALFRELLMGADAEARRVAAYALGCLRERSAEEDLCRVLESAAEAPAVKGQAAEALGYLALESSLPCLLRAAHDPSPEVRFWTAFALGQIGSHEGEPVLEQLAETDHASVEGWGKVSAEAAMALETIRSGGH